MVMQFPFYDTILLGVMAFNFASLWAVSTPFFKRLNWPSVVALGISLGLSLGWMLLCGWFYEARSRKTERALRLLTLAHLAPSITIYVVLCLLLIWIQLR